MTIRVAEASTEYLRIPVTKSGEDTDPTDEAVEFSFPAEGVAPTVWVAGSWEAGGPPYIARALLTAGDLDPGAYDVYLRINPPGSELVAFHAERLVIFAGGSLLASVSQLGDKLQADIDPEDARAWQALSDASGFIRAYTGQQITLVEEDEVQLRPSWTQRLYLPQRPVLDVQSVSVQAPGDTAESVLDIGAFTFDRRGLLIWTSDYFPGPYGVVRVSYSHGYSVVPADIQGVCLSLSARGMANPVGAVSKQIGQAQATFESTTEGAAVGLRIDEARILDRYRSWELS